MSDDHDMRLITPYGKIKHYKKKLNFSVGMSRHKLFGHIRDETRMVGLL